MSSATNLAPLPIDLTSSAWRSWRPHLCTALFFAAVVLCTWQCTGTGSVTLDESWAEGLHHFFWKQSRAGIDYVFTFGPLGMLCTPVYHPSTYWLVITWQLILALTVAYLTMRLVRRMPSRTMQFCLCLSVLATGHFYDLRYIFLIFGSAALLLLEDVNALALIMFACLLSLVSLMKFTFMVLIFAGLGFVLITKLIERKYIAAACLFPTFGFALLATWLALGQSASHFPSYLQRSWEIAQGYVDGMSSAGNRKGLAIACLVAGAVISVIGIVAWRARRKPAAIAYCALALFGLHMSFRHGYIRQDGHIVNFYSFAILAYFLVLLFDIRLLQAKKMQALLFAICIASYVGIRADWPQFHVSSLVPRIAECKSRLEHIFRPQTELRELETRRHNYAEQWALPRVRATVKDAAIDMISCEQAALFLNDLSWSPRPVFQSYSAYTPTLLRLNEDWYRTKTAPAFVLLRLQPIDGRFPGHEEGGVLRALLERYDPLFEEKGFYLLARRPEARSCVPIRTTTTRFAFGEEISLPDDPNVQTTVAFELSLGPRGKMLKALYRNPFLRLHVVLADGQRKSWRLIPGMASEEFLISPMWENTQEFVELFSTTGSKRVVSFSVTEDKMLGLAVVDAYEPNGVVTIRSYQTLDSGE